MVTLISIGIKGRVGEVGIGGRNGERERLWNRGELREGESDRDKGT